MTKTGEDIRTRQNREWRLQVAISREIQRSEEVYWRARKERERKAEELTSGEVGD